MSSSSNDTDTLSSGLTYPEIRAKLFYSCQTGAEYGIHHGRNRALGYQYYTCANKLRKGKAVCDQDNVRSDALHELLLLTLEEKLATIGSDGAFWARYKSAARSTAAHLRRLQEIDVEIEQSASNVTQMLIKTPSLSDTLRDLVTLQTDQAIKKLQAEKIHLQGELDELSFGNEELIQLQQEVEHLCKSDHPLRLTSDDAELRELFHKWLQAITLFNVKAPGLHRKKAVRIEWKIDVRAGSGLYGLNVAPHRSPDQTRGRDS